ELGIEVFENPRLLFFGDGGDDVAGEIDHLLEVSHRNAHDKRDPRRHVLEKPDVGNRTCELDVAHALAAHNGARDLHSAFLADDALVADASVLAAVALEIPVRTEDLLVEEAVSLGAL